MKVKGKDTMITMDEEFTKVRAASLEKAHWP